MKISDIYVGHLVDGTAPSFVLALILTIALGVGLAVLATKFVKPKKDDKHTKLIAQALIPGIVSAVVLIVSFMNIYSGTIVISGNKLQKNIEQKYELTFKNDIPSVINLKELGKETYIVTDENGNKADLEIHRPVKTTKSSKLTISVHYK